MAGYRSSRIIPTALVLIIVILAIAALVSLTRLVFFPDDQSTDSRADTSHQELINTAVDHSVKMTIRGPIVAEEDFHSYQIVVSPLSRTLTTYVGYINKKVDEVVLDNNVPAYEEFVYALDRASLAKGAELSGDDNDTRGICAIGRVYEFEVLKADVSIKKLWTTTCGSSAKGSLVANLDQLASLFTKQIPGGALTISRLHL
jgi:hypothetical protein